MAKTDPALNVRRRPNYADLWREIAKISYKMPLSHGQELEWVAPVRYTLC